MLQSFRHKSRLHGDDHNQGMSFREISAMRKGEKAPSIQANAPTLLSVVELGDCGSPRRRLM